MLIISFSWTTQALRARAKCVTRRNWIRSHAEKFRAGMLVQAWSAAPHHRGEKIGVIELTHDPAPQDSRLANDQDWIDEGFAWYARHGTPIEKQRATDIWRQWHHPSTARDLYVVRFNIVELYTWEKREEVEAKD